MTKYYRVNYLCNLETLRLRLKSQCLVRHENENLKIIVCQRPKVSIEFYYDTQKILSCRLENEQKYIILKKNELSSCVEFFMNKYYEDLIPFGKMTNHTEVPTVERDAKRFFKFGQKNLYCYIQNVRGAGPILYIRQYTDSSYKIFVDLSYDCVKKLGNLFHDSSEHGLFYNLSLLQRSNSINSRDILPDFITTFALWTVVVGTKVMCKNFKIVPFPNKVIAKKLLRTDPLSEQSYLKMALETFRKLIIYSVPLEFYFGCIIGQSKFSADLSRFPFYLFCSEKLANNIIQSETSVASVLLALFHTDFHEIEKSSIAELVNKLEIWHPFLTADLIEVNFEHWNIVEPLACTLLREGKNIPTSMLNNECNFSSNQYSMLSLPATYYRKE